jgi:hypothetical protein
VITGDVSNASDVQPDWRRPAIGVFRRKVFIAQIRAIPAADHSGHQRQNS